MLRSIFIVSLAGLAFSQTQQIIDYCKNKGCGTPDVIDKFVGNVVITKLDDGVACYNVIISKPNDELKIEAPGVETVIYHKDGNDCYVPNDVDRKQSKEIYIELCNKLIFNIECYENGTARGFVINGGANDECIGNSLDEISSKYGYTLGDLSSDNCAN